MMTMQIDWSEVFQGICIGVLGALGAYNHQKARRAVRPETKISVDGNGTRMELEKIVQLFYAFREDTQRNRIADLQADAAQSERIARLEASFIFLARSMGRAADPIRPNNPD